MRMLLPEMLPQLQRVLHLDSDVVVCDALDALWATDRREQGRGRREPVISASVP